MKALPAIGLLLLAAGCIAEPVTQSGSTAPTACLEHPTPEAIEGKTLQATDQACPQREARDREHIHESEHDRDHVRGRVAAGGAAAAHH